MSQAVQEYLKGIIEKVVVATSHRMTNLKVCWLFYINLNLFVAALKVCWFLYIKLNCIVQATTHRIIILKVFLLSYIYNLVAITDKVTQNR